MSCGNTDRLAQALVGINIMAYMCVHAFQDVLLEIDTMIGHCGCEECQALELEIRRAKGNYEVATLYYMVTADIAEKALGGIDAEWKVPRV